MKLTNPRFASLMAIIALLVYVALNIMVEELEIGIRLGLLVLISIFIGLAAFNFAANEMKETAGVSFTLELGFKKIIAILFFSLFLIIGYDMFVIFIVQMFNPSSTLNITELAIAMVSISVFFITIYPFFQLLNLAREGEQSSIPSEFVIEKMVEKIARAINSPFLAGVILYGILYIGPIVIINEVINDQVLSIFIWSILLPLISVSALAGAGIGEDLIRLRLVKNPFTDLKKLGLPKISITKLKFETGGLFLIILAIQVIITTFYFGMMGLYQAAGGKQVIAGTIPMLTLFIALLNKGRGATKEITQVWKETGFKVSIYQLFLPIFVFLGVILSSILEVFINNPVGLFTDIGLDKHIQLIAGFLAIQNFVLVFTALYIYKTTPATAERRLIAEIPEFHQLEDGTPDIKGYLYMYKKLKSDRAVENLLKVISKMIRKDIAQFVLLKDLLKETLSTGSARIQTAASETVYTIVEKIDTVDDDLLELAKIAINSEHSGSRIYGIRSYKILISRTDDGLLKERLIKDISDKLNDDDNVVAWDTGIILQKIIEEDEAYRSFVLAHVSNILLNTDKKTAITSINRLFTKMASNSQKAGQMAISVLSTRLASKDIKNIDNLILAIRSILRGNPQLAVDLIDIVAMGTMDPDIQQRKQSYIVLINLAEYSEGIDKEIINLVLQGINDESEEIQELSYSALKNEVKNSPEHIKEVYTIINTIFIDLRGVALIGALEVLEAIVMYDNNLSTQIFSLIENAVKSSNDIVRAKILKIFTSIIETNHDLADEVYRICEKIIGDQNEDVRQNAIYAMGQAVSAQPSLSRVVYRRINSARNDSSFKVQLAAIEALGFVAFADKSFSDEISHNLKPLLNDNNWRVRMASFNGIFAASKSRKDLQEELVHLTIVALNDPDQLVRESAFDSINWLVTNYRPSAEIIVKEITKQVKKVDDEVLNAFCNSLEIIAERKLSLLEKIVPLLERGFNSYDASTRNSALNALNAVMSKLSKAREPSKEMHKVLNRMVTNLLKAANNSNSGVRRNSYEGLTTICVAVPLFKVASRARRSLNTALKAEKDVGLITMLERAVIRARVPMDYKK